MQSILCNVKEPFHLMYYNSPKTYGNTFKSSPFLCVSEQYPPEYRKVGITLHLFGYGDDPKKLLNGLRSDYYCKCAVSDAGTHVAFRTI